MNIQYLQKHLSRLKEIKIIGKTAEIRGVIYHIMGVVRYERRLRLLALQYDEDFAERAEEAEISELNGLSERARTNRERLRRDRVIAPTNIFQAVSKVKIGAAQFEVKGTESTRCNIQNWEITAMLIEFLGLGGNPEGIDYQNIDNLFLTAFELAGDYTSIPDFGENPLLLFTSRPEYISHFVEQPVMLLVGTEYPDKFWFLDQKTDEKHWMQINRVYLCDMWRDLLKTFDNPRLKEQFTPEELDERKADFENRFSEICPRGMYFPVIEYECEDGLTLQFYPKAWLDAEPVYSNSCMGFFTRPDEKSGIWGLPLKAALIEEPMTEDTNSIRAELFCYNKLEKYNDVII